MTPSKYQILTLVGGISNNSLNQKLFSVIQELAPQEFELQQLQLTDFPYYSQDSIDVLSMQHVYLPKL